MPGRHTQFKPGQSGNPAGRPKGRLNRRTAVKNLVQPVLAAVNEQGIGTFFRQLSSKQRAQIYIRAMELQEERAWRLGGGTTKDPSINLTLVEIERQESARAVQQYKELRPPIVGADFPGIAPSSGDD